jgi:hypothetical protein
MELHTWPETWTGTGQLRTKFKRKECNDMDESKPETGQSDKPEQSGDGCASNNTEGDFELSDLLRAHQRTIDEQRPAVPWSTPQRRDK